MRVVVFVVYVGDSVGDPGGGGTFTEMPPLGSPNGYRLGSAAGLAVAAVAAVTATASATAAPTTRVAPRASKIRGRGCELKGMDFPLDWSLRLAPPRITAPSSYVSTANLHPRFARAS